MFYDVLRLSCNELHLEETELVVNYIQLVNDCRNSLVFLDSGTLEYIVA